MPPAPITVTGGPPDVLTRVRHALPLVRNPWFPTPRELRDWEASEAALYARVLAADTLEVGPRTFTLWAACFSPTWRLTLRPAGPGQTLVSFSDGRNDITLALLVLWTLLLVGWAAAIFPGVAAGDEHWSWLIWWSIVAFATFGGPMIGRREGGKALTEAYAGLVETLTGDAGEDW